MTLKKRILVNKVLFPAVCLFFLVIYLINSGMNNFKAFYGFYLFYAALWIVISLISISKTTNHLINYSTEKEIIKFTFYKKLNTIQQIEVPIYSIKKTKLDTRSFQFGFDVLKIYYIDKHELHQLLELRISDKKDWVSILSMVEKTN